MSIDNSIFQKVPYNKCTGCFGCYNACPRNAIKMALSPYGFYHPELLEDRCSNCGLCSRHCPVLTVSSSHSGNRSSENIISYAAWSKNKQLRKRSSSGGSFTEIAKAVLAQNGVIYGVRWKSGWTPGHARTESSRGLLSFRSSKYLQSSVGLAYRQIKKLTESGRTVLFSGLPCQVAALHNFTDNENLITLDLVCHGTPSTAVFHKYLQYISGSRTVKSVNFRSKRNGWSKFELKIDFTDGSCYSETFRKDPFLAGFLSDLYLNDACYSCPFCSLPRQGDLTLADYWGVPKDYKNDLGVSLILSNNEKGDRLLSILPDKGNIELIKTPFETTLRGNPRITNGDLHVPVLREKYLRELQQNSFADLEFIINEVNCFDKEK